MTTSTRTYAIETDAGLRQCFDATAARVFASLCHLTVGDRSWTPRLLADTYLHALERAHASSHAVDEPALILIAHRTFLQQAGLPHAASPAPEADWERVRWGEAMDAITDLQPEQRAALNLRVLEGRAPEVVAACLDVSPTDADALVNGSLAALGRAGLTDSVPELFRHTELWVDDLERERVRNYVMSRSGSAARSPDAVAKRRHRLLNVTAAIVAAVAAGLLAWWVLGGPEDTGTPVNLITPESSAPSSDASVPSSERGTVTSATPVVEPQPTTTLAGG